MNKHRKSGKGNTNVRDLVVVAFLDDMDQAREYETLLRLNDIPAMIKEQLDSTADGKTGWLHESTLSKKPIAMKAGTSDVATGASSEEVALAGKGFNEQVEGKVRSEGKLDYTWVDKMSKFESSPDQIALFRAQGSLLGGGR